MSSIVHKYFRETWHEEKQIWLFYCLVEECDAMYTCEAGEKSSTSGRLRHLRNKHKELLSQAPPTPLITDFTVKKLTPEVTNQVHQAFLNWLIKDMIPFVMADSPSLALVFRLARTSYEPPCRQTLTARLTVTANKVRIAVFADIQATALSVAITYDCWTSKAKHPYVAITGHWITEDAQMKRCCLLVQHLPGSHTGELLGRTILDRMATVKSDVQAQTLDNAANGMKGAEIVQQKIGAEIVPCVAHTLQIDIVALLSTYLGDFVVVVTSVFTHFAHSTQAQESLVAIQQAMGSEHPPVKIISPVCTRWNSLYRAVSRLVDLRDVLPGLLQARASKAAGLKPLTEEHWEFAEAVITILGPVDFITERLSGETYPTLSEVLPCIKQLLMHFGMFIVAEAGSHHSVAKMINKYRENEILKPVLTFTEHLRNAYKNRFHQMPNCAYIATALNPRYRGFSFAVESRPGQPPKNDMMDKAIDLLDGAYRKEFLVVQQEELSARKTTPVAPSESSSKKPPLRHSAKLREDFAKQMNTQTTERHLRRGNDELAIFNSLRTLKDNETILEWWNAHRTMCPILWRLARRYLAIPATSVPSERLFSDGGNIVSQKRCSLDTEVASDLIFCKQNEAYLPK